MRTTFACSLSAWNALDVTQAMLTEIGDDSPADDAGRIDQWRQDASPRRSRPRSFPIRRIVLQHPSSTRGERFQLIRQHARGGIGQVWLARDGELQRDVAVKEIQPRYAESENQRARFVLEAEITGNLEHPGIVPVYSLGRNAEGRPYYAMRFIEGESLSAAIRRFHKPGGEEDGKAETRQASIVGH